MERLIKTGHGYPFGAAVVLVAAALMLPLRPVLQAPAIMLAFVPVIIVLARVFGLGVSTMASFLAFLVIDFLFLPPYYRLVVGSAPEWVGLITFLIVALVAGQQTGVLRRRERAAVRRQAELELLNSLSAHIASASSIQEISEFAVQQAADVLGALRAALYVPAAPGGPARCLASAGSPVPTPSEDVLAARFLRMASRMERSASGTRDPMDSPEGIEVRGLYLTLETQDEVEGVLHLVLPESDKLHDQVDDKLLSAVANLIAASIQRLRLEETAARADALREADRLRSTFVSSVSHELKTPLAAATARVTGLLGETEGDGGRIHRELADISDDLGRLNASIGDLLDLSRLEADDWRPQFEDNNLADVLGTVVSRLPVDQRRRVHFALSASADNLCCDFAQLARALTNLVENALAYSPAGSRVSVSSREVDGVLLVSVEDTGPGIAEDEQQRVFEKFYRGAASSAAPGGTGLGLTITREIVRTHGGRLWVESPELGGTRFVLALPAGACREGGIHGIA